MVDITALNEIIDNYDEALTQVVKEGWVEDGSKAMEQFGINFEKLKKFAKQNPTFDHCRSLNKMRSDAISYFYGDAILHAERAERKAYEARMRHYDNMY
jgi:hypothetical protein